MFVLQALLVVSAVSADGPTTLVQFTAPWCTPCKSMEPTVKRLAQQKYPVLIVDIDQRKDLADRFGVREIPCFVMLVDGREVERATGIVSYDRFTQMYRRAGYVPQDSGRQGFSPQPSRQLATQQSMGQNPGNRRVPGPMAQNGFAQHTPRVNSAVGQSGSLPIRSVGNQYSKSPAQQNSAPELTPQQRAMYATVRLKVTDPGGHNFGTGTVIDSHGNEALVLTCAHIFRNSSSGVTADLYAPGAGRGRPGQVISMDAKNDIALVSVQALAPVVVARVAPEGVGLQSGRSVFSVGCNRGADPTLERGQITTVNRYLGPPNIEVSGRPEIGRSGGGLFTNDGLLIGVCNCADEADNEGLYASLPIVHWQLAQVGMQRLYQPQPTVNSGNQMLANNQSIRQPQRSIHNIPTTPANLPANRAATMVPISTPQPGSPSSETQSIGSGTLNELLGLLALNPASTTVSYYNSRGQVVSLDRDSLLQLQRLAGGNSDLRDADRFAARQRYIQPDTRDEQGRTIRAQSKQ